MVVEEEGEWDALSAVEEGRMEYGRGVAVD